MPALSGEKHTRYQGDQFQAVKGYAHRQAWLAPAAAANAVVLAAQSVAALVTAGITNPDFARVLSIVGGGGTHTASGNVVIIGTDIRDQVITDTIALNSNTVVNGVKAFKTVTSVDLTGVSGIGAASTVSVGISAILGLGRCMSEDSYINGQVNNVYEATRATVTISATVISLNTVSFNTAPNASRNFVAWQLTTELYAGK